MLLGGFPMAASSANLIQLDAGAPVITSLKPTNFEVLVEEGKALSLDDVIAANGQFKSSAAVMPIQSTKVYWLAFQIGRAHV